MLEAHHCCNHFQLFYSMCFQNTSISSSMNNLDKTALAKRHLPFGAPMLMSNDLANVTLLYQPNYITAFSTDLKQPLWISTTLTSDMVRLYLFGPSKSLKPSLRSQVIILFLKRKKKKDGKAQHFILQIQNMIKLLVCAKFELFWLFEWSLSFFFFNCILTIKWIENDFLVIICHLKMYSNPITICLTQWPKGSELDLWSSTF